MTILKRITHLFRADFNAVLDEVEEPEVILRQAVRDMSQHLNQLKHQQSESQRKLQLLQRQEADVAEDVQRYEKEIATCFEAEKPDLAKSFVRRKLSCEQQYQKLAALISQLKQEQACLTDEIKEKSLQHKSMEQKLEIFSQENLTTQYADFSITEDEVELAFIKAQQSFGAKAVKS